MRTRELADLLSAHAEGLNAGRDLAGDLLAKQPEAASTLQPLLGLARRAQAALRPVEPSAAFVSTLKAQLARPAAPAPASAAARPSWVVLALAGVGGLISLASAVLFVSRYFAGGTRRMRTAL